MIDPFNTKLFVLLSVLFFIRWLLFQSTLSTFKLSLAGTNVLILFFFVVSFITFSGQVVGNTDMAIQLETCLRLA